MTTLEDLCFWHKIAAEEKEMNDMSEVIKSYKKIGCYSCDGYNQKCIFYEGMKQKDNYEGM